MHPFRNHGLLLIQIYFLPFQTWHLEVLKQFFLSRAPHPYDANNTNYRQSLTIQIDQGQFVVQRQILEAEWWAHLGGWYQGFYKLIFRRINYD